MAMNHEALNIRIPFCTFTPLQPDDRQSNSVTLARCRFASRSTLLFEIKCFGVRN